MKGTFLGENQVSLIYRCGVHLVPQHHLNTLYSLYEVINAVSWLIEDSCHICTNCT